MELDPKQFLFNFADVFPILRTIFVLTSSLALTAWTLAWVYLWWRGPFFPQADKGEPLTAAELLRMWAALPPEDRHIFRHDFHTFAEHQVSDEKAGGQDA
jgi:hypothetical protein